MLGAALKLGCNALYCSTDGYADLSTSITNQIAVQVGQKQGPEVNFQNVVKTLESLVEDGNIVSEHNGAEQFQLNFQANVNNKFKITGCNNATGTDCIPADTPTDPGCYTRQPNGCPDGKMDPTTVWTRDTWGEANATPPSGSSQIACEGRKSAHDGWCGNSDSQWAFVPETSDPCEMEVTTHFQVCPVHHLSPTSECYKCTHGQALVAQEVELLTDQPDCKTWFIKADAVVRSLTSHLRTFWLVDRVNLCKDTNISARM